VLVIAVVLALLRKNKAQQNLLVIVSIVAVVASKK